jgi:hypothetical protein
MSKARLPASFAEVRPRRSVFFFALGGIFGLALAGYGLFTAPGTTTHAVPPEDVAVVNHRPILRSDYLAQLQQVYGASLAEATPAQRARILADMIHEELFVQRGLELDMPSSDPDTRTALVAAVDQQIVADIITRQPSDAVLGAYYETHKERYATYGSMAVHDLVGSDPAALVAAAEALSRRDALGDVLAAYGLKETGKVTGEELYFAAKLHLGDRLFAIAAGLHDHEVSAPVADGDATHLLVMEKNVVPVPRSFAEAREQVLADYRRSETERLTAAEEAFLRERAEILIAPDFR